MADPTNSVLGIFENPYLSQLILPFLLIFAIVFAILQKTSILGKDKKAVDVIVAIVLAFIFVGAPAAVGVTLKIIPIISLIIVILLCFLLLFGFVGIQVPENKGLKVTIGIILGLALVGTILWATGIMNNLPSVTSQTLQYIIFGVILVGAIVAVIFSGSGSKKKSSD